jgi:hypothetical protein
VPTAQCTNRIGGQNCDRCFMSCGHYLWPFVIVLRLVFLSCKASFRCDACVPDRGIGISGIGSGCRFCSGRSLDRYKTDIQATCCQSYVYSSQCDVSLRHGYDRMIISCDCLGYHCASMVALGAFHFIFT